MRTQSMFSVLSLPLLLVTVLLSSCDKGSVAPETQIVEQINANGHMDIDYLNQQLDNLPLEELSAEELEGLLFMREEEKLAYDVYFELFQQWQTPVFNNIAGSEWNHTNAVLQLIERYELVDPVKDNPIGTFINPELQKLFDELKSRGLTSEEEALKVGALIEEVDIVDLELQLTETVDNQDIQMIYHNLLAASKNHLRAFVKQLNQRGIDYTPQVLSLQDYNTINY